MYAPSTPTRSRCIYRYQPAFLSRRFIDESAKLVCFATPSAQRLSPNPQARDRDGWTCLHHALSLPDQSPATTAWIAMALALPSAAALRETALRDLASHAAEAVPLELFRGAGGAAQVMWT